MRETTTHRALVFTALLLAMFMSAIEVTIVATAMPSISAELGGFELYSWVFSSYLLVQAVTIPMFGKLSDLSAASRCSSAASWSFCWARSPAGSRGPWRC